MAHLNKKTDKFVLIMSQRYIGSLPSTYISTSDASFNQIASGDSDIEIKIDKNDDGYIALYERIPESSSQTTKYIYDPSYSSFRITFVPLD